MAQRSAASPHAPRCPHPPPGSCWQEEKPTGQANPCPRRILPFHLSCFQEEKPTSEVPWCCKRNPHCSPKCVVHPAPSPSTAPVSPSPSPEPVAEPPSTQPGELRCRAGCAQPSSGCGCLASFCTPCFMPAHEWLAELFRSAHEGWQHAWWPWSGRGGFPHHAARCSSNGNLALVSSQPGRDSRGVH